jgi:hypothetical protein
MMLQPAGLALAQAAPGYRHAGLYDTFRPPGAQRVPGRQIFAFAKQPVGAARGQPVDVPQPFWGELHTIWHMGAAVPVIAAAPGIHVEQAAGDICEADLIGDVIAQFVQAAATAAITE